MKETYFEDSPLGEFASRHRNKKNFIDKFNDFLMFSSRLDLWKQAGKPNPFDDSDISIEQLFKANMQ